MTRAVIRRATPADAEAVRTLSRGAYARWVPVIGREPRPIQADYRLAVVQHLIDLLEDGGDLVGLVEMVPGADHLLIENVAVRPDRHGGGLGSHLLRHAESVARSFGLAEMRLYTNAAFASNVTLYLRRGYSEDRRETTSAFGTTVYMSKRLAEGG